MCYHFLRRFLESWQSLEYLILCLIRKFFTSKGLFLWLTCILKSKQANNKTSPSVRVCAHSSPCQTLLAAVNTDMIWRIWASSFISPRGWRVLYILWNNQCIFFICHVCRWGCQKEGQALKSLVLAHCQAVTAFLPFPWSGAVLVILTPLL